MVFTIILTKWFYPFFDKVSFIDLYSYNRLQLAFVYFLFNYSETFMFWNWVLNFNWFVLRLYVLILGSYNRLPISFNLFLFKLFRDLRVLILGSGSGGWVTEAYSEKFLLGIPSMTHLVHFSLKYDCTPSILQVTFISIEMLYKMT